MTTVNIHEAKTNLSRLMERVAQGESFVIAKAGRPVAKMIPIDAPETPAAAQRFGFMSFEVPDDFDEMAREEIERLFGGDA